MDVGNASRLPRHQVAASMGGFQSNFVILTLVDVGKFGSVSEDASSSRAVDAFPL